MSLEKPAFSRRTLLLFTDRRSTLIQPLKLSHKNCVYVDRRRKYNVNQLLGANLLFDTALRSIHTRRPLDLPQVVLHDVISDPPKQPIVVSSSAGKQRGARVHFCSSGVVTDLKVVLVVVLVLNLVLVFDSDQKVPINEPRVSGDNDSSSPLFDIGCPFLSLPTFRCEDVNVYFNKA